VLAVSEDPNKTAEESLTAASDGSASADEARAAGANGRDGRVEEDRPIVSGAAASDAAGEEEDTSEVVPVEQKPLARPALHGSEEEKAKKKAEEGPIEMDWYILKVQSNRERSIADALKRKIAIEGLDKYVDQIIVPTEKVTEFKAGKKKVVERKLYPGYIVVHMAINDDTWFAVRETSGIGDFTGAGGKPSPMLPHEVARIVQAEEEETAEAPKLDIKFNTGDRVKVKDGTFEGFEGEVSAIDTQSGKITVMINIFGRSTPVELEYWQVEGV
jgi:transcription termination/antitermination protein NusG